MKREFYILSAYPLTIPLEFPAELLAEDLVDLIRDNKTLIFETLKQAICKKKEKELKFIYSLTVEILED